VLRLLARYKPSDVLSLLPRLAQRCAVLDDAEGVDEIASHVAGMKALARQRGREIDVYTGVITCPPTR
jgi:hypothetical protein